MSSHSSRAPTKKCEGAAAASVFGSDGVGTNQADSCGQSRTRQQSIAYSHLHSVCLHRCHVHAVIRACSIRRSVGAVCQDQSSKRSSASYTRDAYSHHFDQADAHPDPTRAAWSTSHDTYGRCHRNSISRRYHGIRSKHAPRSEQQQRCHRRRIFEL